MPTENPEAVLSRGIQDLMADRAVDVTWSSLEFRKPEVTVIAISKGFFLTEVRINDDKPATFRWRDDRQKEWQTENADFMPTLVERIRARVSALY